MVHINPIIIAIRRKFFEEHFSNALLFTRERFFCVGRLCWPLLGLISSARKECRLVHELQRRPEIGVNTVRKRSNLVPVS